MTTTADPVGSVLGDFQARVRIWRADLGALRSYVIDDRGNDLLALDLRRILKTLDELEQQTRRARRNALL